MPANILDIYNLTVAVKKHVIFQDLNLRLAENEIVTIIGDSGAGKTTLLKSLNGLLPIASGSVSIYDEVVLTKAEEHKKDLSRKIGLVFQDFNLYPHLTVMENITLALRLKKTYSKDVITGQALKWLKLLHLESKKDVHPRELSGGEKQRVAIARAAVLNPLVLCFDEPTSALDPLLTNALAKIIKELSKTMTILIVTHDIEFAKTVSDRIVVMRNGTIVKDEARDTYFEN